MHQETMPRQVDIKSQLFEERAKQFRVLVQATGIFVGGEEEWILRRLGKQIVEFHSLPEGEEKEKLREEIGEAYDTLRQSGNPKTNEGMFNVVMGEIAYF